MTRSSRALGWATLALVMGCAGERRPPLHPLRGARAPDLKGDDVPGSPSARFPREGVIVVVDFWATHCAPCAAALPRLQELERRHPGRVRVIGVSEDDDLDLVPPFVERAGARFSMLWDRGRETSARYGVDRLPETFVIDEAGIVRFVAMGAGDPEALDRAVSSLLDSPPAP